MNEKINCLSSSSQFSPINPSQVLVTSGDCRTRVVEGTQVVQKFIGDDALYFSFMPKSTE